MNNENEKKFSSIIIENQYEKPMIIDLEQNKRII